MKKPPFKFLLFIFIVYLALFALVSYIDPVAKICDIHRYSPSTFTWGIDCPDMGGAGGSW